MTAILPYVHFVYEIAGPAELIDDEQYIAYVHIYAPLEIRFEHDVGTH